MQNSDIQEGDNLALGQDLSSSSQIQEEIETEE